MNSGTALNIVPNLCTIDFEIRNIADEDPDLILDRIRNETMEIAKAAASVAPEVSIDIEVINSYPGLDTPVLSNVVKFMKLLMPFEATTKVSFGTEGGLFNINAGIPTIICGPGHMSQGHKPDEFVSNQQINLCDLMLNELLLKMKAENIQIKYFT